MKERKPKNKKIVEGVSYSQITKELGIFKNTIKSFITQGELKLNDYDRIDEEYYLKFKEKWKGKEKWMKNR